MSDPTDTKKVVAERCDKRGGLKAGDLHQFSVCAMEAIQRQTDKIKELQAQLDEASTQRDWWQELCGKSRDAALNPWISVDERLPESMDDVLVTFIWDASPYNCVARRNRLGYWEAYSEEIGDYTTWEGGGDVTHWMPIPTNTNQHQPTPTEG